jgi:hypothetical protein
MYRQMTRTTFGLVLPLVITALVSSCNKDVAPPPLPAASAPPTDTAAPIAMEPIAEPVEDAGVKPVGGPYRPAASLTACCNALMQNAASAPEPTATYMKQAAATCASMAAQGKDKASVAGILLGVLRGGGLPSSCR